MHLKCWAGYYMTVQVEYNLQNTKIPYNIMGQSLDVDISCICVGISRTTVILMKSGGRIHRNLRINVGYFLSRYSYWIESG